MVKHIDEEKEILKMHPDMKRTKKFSHPRWTEPLKPQRLFKSDLTPEQFKEIHQDLIKSLREGTVKKEDYDEFMNN